MQLSQKQHEKLPVDDETSDAQKDILTRYTKLEQDHVEAPRPRNNLIYHKNPKLNSTVKRYKNTCLRFSKHLSVQPNTQ